MNARRVWEGESNFLWYRVSRVPIGLEREGEVLE